jgi:HlyD family secretion protein
VAQDIVASEKASLDPVFAHALAVGAAPSSGRTDVIEAMRSLVRVLVAELIGTAESQNTSQIMLQEQIAPTPAFHIFFDGVYRGAIEAWAALLSRLTGLAPDSLELRLRALSILGQITIFRVGMAAVLRLLERETLARSTSRPSPSGHQPGRGHRRGTFPDPPGGRGMNARRILPAALVLAVAGGAWWLWADRAERTNAEIRLYGNVDIREVDLSFRIPGKLAEVRVDEGDAVAAGDVVAVLDAAPYRDALARARAQRDAAAADMAKHHAGYRREDVAKARAEVARLEAQVENAVRVARRRQTLLLSGAIAAQDYDDAAANRDALSAQLESARKELELQATGFRSEDILASEASLRAADAAVDAALTDLADTEIIAPSDGMVLARVREPGAVAPAGATILTVALARRGVVRAYVPEPLLGRVRLGMSMRVFTDSRPTSPHSGRVGFISPVAEFTPKNVETTTLRTDLVYRLRILIDEPDQGHVAGHARDRGGRFPIDAPPSRGQRDRAPHETPWPWPQTCPCASGPPPPGPGRRLGNDPGRPDHGPGRPGRRG